MATAATLLVPFNMDAFDFSDITNGTMTSFSSTEVDYTGAGGVNHYVFKGSGFGAIDENAPITGSVTDFSINGVIDVTNITFEPSVGDILSFGWHSSMLIEATVFGTSGDDVLDGSADTILKGFDGNDTLNAHFVSDTLAGGKGDDILVGENIPNDYLDTTASYSDATSGVVVDLGKTTSQNVGGGLGHDTLTFVNKLIGSKFDDRLLGDVNDNTLNSGKGLDHLAGDYGNDTLIAHNGADLIVGGPGFDTVQYSTKVGVTIDMTLLKGVEKVIGSQLNDAITGTSHADIIQGGNGDDVLSGLASQDTLRGGAGNDTLNGGAGADTAEYTKSTDGVHVDLTLSGPQFISTSSGTDTLISIENVSGSAFDDVITGDGSANVLSGGGGHGADTIDGGGGGHGADTIDGGGGNDVINGGPGADILTGGSGSDTFVYTLFDNIGQSTTHGTDLITDFDASQDHFAFGIAAGVGATPFQPSSLDILTTGAANSATFTADIANAVGTLASHAAVLFTASSGDLAGHTYLIVNGQDESNHFAQTDVVIELGPGSNLTGFSLSDFI